MNLIPLPAFVAKMNADEAYKSSIPEELNQITDVVLAYKPKPKSKAAKKRKRKAERDAKTA